MSLPIDLLEQARHLTSLDRRRPKQANLRRAISSAYYALFHLLVAESSNRMSPNGPSDLSRRIARSFGHAEMRQVCRSISEGHPSLPLRELQPGGFSPEIVLVAESFANLQDERHRADYDLSAIYTRVESIDLVDVAESAFRAWKRVREREEANIFLAALLFTNRWSK